MYIYNRADFSILIKNMHWTSAFDVKGRLVWSAGDASYQPVNPGYTKISDTQSFAAP